MTSSVLTACNHAGPDAAADAAPTSGATVTTPSAGATAQLPLTPSFDLNAIARDIRLGLRAEGGGYRGGQPTYESHVDASTPSVTTRDWREGAAAPRVGPTVTFATESIGRAGRPIAAPGASQLVDGRVEVARGNIVERVENREDGVEQSWRFAARPAGAGDVVVRVNVAGAQFAGVTPGGTHFLDASSGLGVRYGVATWVDAGGRRTSVRSEFDGRSIVLTVPAASVDAAAYPAVLDPTVLPEFTLDTPAVYAPSAGARPDVAFDGTNFLVVWSDSRRGNADLYAARIRASDGVVLDPGGIALNTSTTDQLSPHVAYVSGRFLVVWQDHTTSTDRVRGMRIRSADLSVEGATIDVSPSLAQQFAPVVACDSSNCFVAWSDARVAPAGIFGTRVRMSDGVVLDPSSAFLGVQRSAGLAVAYDGVNYLTIWNNLDLVGARVASLDGALLDATPILISAAAGNQTLPALVFEAGLYFAAWVDTRAGNADVYGARIDPVAAVTLDPAGIPISTGPQVLDTLAVTGDGANAIVTFAEFQGATYALFAKRVRMSDGVLLDAVPVLVAGAPNNSRLPAAAFGGGRVLVTWEDRTGTTQPVMAARLRPTDLGAIDVPAIVVSVIANEEASPSIAFDGTNYLVVWRDDRADGDIYGVRVRDSDGAVLDAPAIAISAGTGLQTNPSVTYGAGNFYVVWEDHRSGGSDIYGARVRPSDAVVLDPTGIPISTTIEAQTAPAVAYNGTDYQVVWGDSRGPVFGTRAHGSDGTPFTALGLIYSPTTAYTPGLACNPTQCLVAWVGASNTGVAATRVRSTDGSVLDLAGISLSTATTHLIGVGIATDGARFLVSHLAPWGLECGLVWADGST
ncbi:MAG: hypothetical protein WCJ30_09405, partial [Deltaproteobacteria bacterium]